MGQFKDLMEELSFTDAVADAKLIRERTQPYHNLRSTTWDYRTSFANLFVPFEIDDVGSYVDKQADQPLGIIVLNYDSTSQVQHEDAAFLLGVIFSSVGEETYSYSSATLSEGPQGYGYAYDFAMELLLPEAGVREILKSEGDRLIYSAVADQYHVSIPTLYRRIKELDLL